jgi:hypothetical protein
MKKKFLLSILFSVTALALLCSPASAAIINLYGIQTDFSATASLEWNDKVLNVNMTNTSTAPSTILTGFAFNVPGDTVYNAFEASEPALTQYNPDKWKAKLGTNFATGAVGNLDLAAYVGNSLISGNPKGGLAGGESALFLFTFGKEFDLGYLTSTNPYNFVARFQGDPDSDVAVVPLPAAAWLLGTGLIGLIAIRRRMKK